ncbi:hypothetical protein RAJCM14343_1792 [Rhodococcus aetherivorans]|uniref:C2H2-type domain-containing protein n=1 Tax=Rhodococcus aetherivorans TaxID=191292 RepID=A0ABQ0YJ47_9NOCA|nr:hypothetical protein RAJCM14343_1792 [Rhodococcus aetherivorans]
MVRTPGGRLSEPSCGMRIHECSVLDHISQHSARRPHEASPATTKGAGACRTTRSVTSTTPRRA